MSWPRVALLLAVAAGVAAFFLLGLDRSFDLATLKQQRLSLIAQWQRTPLTFAAAFAALNVAALALSLPGAVFGFAIAAGAIFGPWWGTAIALGAVVAGDSLAFLGARYLFRQWVERRFARHVRRAGAGTARDGVFYLLALRLTAVVPYFVTNLTMGLTRMKLREFAPVSFVGLLPATFLYVQAGSQLSAIASVGDIFTPRLIVIFALLGLLPLAARLAVRRWHRRTRRRGNTQPI